MASETTHFVSFLNMLTFSKQFYLFTIFVFVFKTICLLTTPLFAYRLQPWCTAALLWQKLQKHISQEVVFIQTKRIIWSLSVLGCWSTSDLIHVVFCFLRYISDDDTLTNLERHSFYNLSRVTHMYVSC